MSDDVRKAFVHHFVNEWDSFSLPVAYGNVHYSPQHDEPYAELLFIPGSIDAISAQTFEQVGIFRVILRYPVGVGEVGAHEKAREILSAFPVLSQINFFMTKVRILSGRIDSGVPEDGWFKLVLSLNFQAFTK